MEEKARLRWESDKGGSFHGDLKCPWMSTARQTSATRLLSRQNLHFAALAGREDTVISGTIIRRGINSSRTAPSS
jgi:hypothetical protein